MRSLLLALLLSLPAFAQRPIQLSVDATDAPRNLLHARLRVPVQPGPLTLAYPKWLPGNHRPSGPIANLTGVVMTANGQRLEWQRDPVEMYSLHVNVPPGVSELDVALDAITDDGVAGSSGPAASTQVLDVNWNMVVLYPASAASDDVQVAATLRLPAGWNFGSALEVASRSGDEIAFQPVNLTTLVDSPLIAARHFRRIVLDRDHDPIPHAIDIAAESEADIAPSPHDIATLNNLVAETGALFGARHYRHYDLLLTLSDQVGGRGLEHHQSSDNAPGAKYFTSPQHHLLSASLLSHEFTHSWNGKYRRPIGLATKNYQEPMVGDLLWVYEGLTDYLGNVLAARSGFVTPEQYREELANTAANLDFTTGRAWRPLEDTAVSVQSLRLQGRAWSNWRRGLDYYPEGDLIWLEVDTKIRQLTNNARSLDDFCRAFYGGQSGPPQVLPYNFNDLVKALNGVAPFDWGTLLRERVNAYTTAAPKGGIEMAGWRLIYTDKPNEIGNAIAQLSGGLDLAFSLGLRLSRDGSVGDVIMNSPAFKAGFAPRMRIFAVNGRKYSSDVMTQAVRDAQLSKKPIALIVEYADTVETLEVPYFDGLKFPHLERVSSQPDRLSDITKPRVSPAP